MKIFDAHIHIGGDSKPDPKALIEKMEAGGVYGGGLYSIEPINPDFTYEERMNSLFSWVEGYEDRLFPFAWIHPHEDNVLEQVKDCAKRGVAGFKFIAGTYSIRDEKAQDVFRLVEELRLPAFFHTGILWEMSENIDDNRPGNWEQFVNYKSLKFCMCHCSYPWYDECLAMYGKFNWMTNHAQKAANGEHTLYANYPWVKEHITEKDGKRIAETPEMYMDTTPGANGLYRDDLLKKLCYLVPDGKRVMFGTDRHAETYQPEVTSYWISEQNRVFDEVHATEEFRNNFYRESFLRFMGKAE